MSEPQFRHATPAYRTFCGEGALAALPRAMTRLGASRVVIICNPSIRRDRSAFGLVEDTLGGHLVDVFDEVQPNSPVPVVQRATEFLEQLEPDAIVVVGSGSAAATSRAATILLAEGSDIRSLATHRNSEGVLVSPRLEASKLPQWIVPSTPTTAYAKAGAAVHDDETGERLALYDPKTRARGVFMDPALASTAPAALARSSALNALTAAVEGLQAQVDDPLADALLAHGLRLVIEWLPRLSKEPNSATPRLQLMVAALLCGQGSDHKGGGLAQTLAHAIAPRSAARNGEIEAMLLPHVLRFNSPSTHENLDRVVEYLGTRPTGSTSEEIAAETVKGILVEGGVSTRLRDTGVPHESLSAIASLALDDWFITQIPRPADLADLKGILDNAW